MACFALFCVGNKNRLPIVFFVYAIYTYPAVVNRIEAGAMCCRSAALSEKLNGEAGKSSLS